MMSEISSRSHAIYTIKIVMKLKGDDLYDEVTLRTVDLAGSERVSKSGVTGMAFKEAVMINKSLSSLIQVVGRLVDSNSKHIPYRDSKLTWLLKDSLGGNSVTMFIGVCSPAFYTSEETIQTMKFITSCKKI